MAADTPDQPQRPAATAGGLLRAAREQQGLHVGALAASIKVTPRKLEALEADRYDELPDATFARALAQTVCRSLRIDPAPVLALLPRADPSALDHAGGTLNTPFRERSGRESAGRLAAAAVRPLVLAAAALLVAAAVVYLLPAGLWRPAADNNAQPVSAAPPASAPSTATLPASAVAAADAAAAVADNTGSGAPALPQPPADGPRAASAPLPPLAAAAGGAPLLQSVAAAAAAQTAASAAAALVQIQAEDASWVEVRDGRGRVLVSRVLQASESAGFDGALPIKLTIGNARGTRLRFRGQAVDLTANTRDNVARLELQ